MQLTRSPSTGLIVENLILRHQNQRYWTICSLSFSETWKRQHSSPHPLGMLWWQVCPIQNNQQKEAVRKDTESSRRKTYLELCSNMQNQKPFDAHKNQIGCRTCKKEEIAAHRVKKLLVLYSKLTFASTRFLKYPGLLK